MTKGQTILLTGGALATVGIIYFGFIKKYENGLTWYKGLTADKEGGDIGTNAGETAKANFQKLATNLGVSIPSNNIIKVKFLDKFQANFFDNNRVAIYKLSSAGQPSGDPMKGTYSNGGLTILRDKDGSQITTNSTYQTLANTVK